MSGFGGVGELVSLAKEFSSSARTPDSLIHPFPFPGLCEKVVIVEGSACCPSAVLPECLSLLWWEDSPGKLEPKVATNVQTWPSSGSVGPVNVFSPYRSLFVFLLEPTFRNF